MRIRLALIGFGFAFALPALADKRIDPDPAFLPKARTAATAKVEPHYDLVSEKVPFWARFVICAGQLTAMRDEGRAMPAPKDEFDKLIADYRARAAELLAYRVKLDPKASVIEADAEIAKVRAGAMEFLPGDVTKIGVDTMKKRAGERLAFCQLTRDWYEVQNGLRQEASVAEQQKLTKEHEEAMKQIAAEAPKPPKVWQVGPMPPAIKPSVVQPRAVSAPAPTGPAAEPMPTAKVIVPPAGSPVSASPKDAIIGPDIAHAGARADFVSRPMWSALAECSARSEVIQAKTGDNTRQWIAGYVERAAYVLWGDREMDHASSAVLATKERDRLRARAAASWDAYRQEHGGAIPHAHWGQVCAGLEMHTHAHSARARAARQAQADREYAEYLRKFNEARATASTSTGTVTTSGGYSGVSSNSSLDAAAAASRAEHQRNMDQYKRDTDRIRQEIRAIDRKYR
jgi:hypothetical protein